MTRSGNTPGLTTRTTASLGAGLIRPDLRDVRGSDVARRSGGVVVTALSGGR